MTQLDLLSANLLTQDDVRRWAGEDKDGQKGERDNEHVKVTIIPLSHAIANLEKETISGVVINDIWFSCSPMDSGDRTDPRSCRRGCNGRRAAA